MRSLGHKAIIEDSEYEEDEIVIEKYQSKY